MTSHDPTDAVARCVAWALDGVVRESPHHFPLLTRGPLRFTRARELTPVFYGCFDWHSAVHSHWLLVRSRRLFPATHWAHAVTDRLDQQLTEDGLSAEAQFLAPPERRSFERPYGWAWLLQLAAELHGSTDPVEKRWSAHLAPLEGLIADRVRDWIPKLLRPVRSGEHSQTAFALGLIADWADTVGDATMRALIHDTALRCYGNDADLPIAWEPSAYDFLSPALAEADLLRRCLPPDAFARWLDRALPGLSEGRSLIAPVTPTDLVDGKSAHFAGLNFSRSWMLEGIAHGLPPDDRRVPRLHDLATEHLAAGLPVLATDEYAVTHWVGSFVVYAVTRRGIWR